MKEAIANTRGLIAALAALALCACGTPSLRSPEAPRIVRGATGTAVSLEELVSALQAAEYVLLGEVHDNALHHHGQEMLLGRLASGGTALVMEPFDLGSQAALDAAAALQGNADAVGAAGGLYGRSWKWADYRPLVEIALAAGMPVAAGNLSRTQARDVVSKGFAALPGNSGLALDAVWNEAREADLAREIDEGHCGKLPAALVPGMARAQRARDALMADTMLRYPRAVLIAGAGHARIDRGVPIYLRQRAPRARIASVGFIEDSAAPVSTRIAAFDFAWITPAAQRADPCATFAPPVTR